MKAYMIGSGIGSLAAAAFMIRDGGVPGSSITIYERLNLLGGCLDGARLPDGAYSLRGGRMLTFDHYECTWDLLSTIPSLEHPGKSVRDETEAFNDLYKAHSGARLVDQNRHKIDVSTMGFSMADRLELVSARRGIRGKTRHKLHHGLALAGLLQQQLLAHVADDVCIPALAQRGGVQTLSAPFHERVPPHRDARRSAAHGLQSIRTRLPAPSPPGSQIRACSSSAARRSPICNSPMRAARFA